MGEHLHSLIYCNQKVKSLELSLASALELVEIRDRQIGLLKAEIELLKKALAGFQNRAEYPHFEDFVPKDKKECDPDA